MQAWWIDNYKINFCELTDFKFLETLGHRMEGGSMHDTQCYVEEKKVFLVARGPTQSSIFRKDLNLSCPSQEAFQEGCEQMYRDCASTTSKTAVVQVMQRNVSFYNAQRMWCIPGRTTNHFVFSFCKIEELEHMISHCFCLSRILRIHQGSRSFLILLKTLSLSVLELYRLRVWASLTTLGDLYW